jgi:hypothetical protein
MDFKEIIIGLGVEVPETIENFDEFKTNAIQKINENARTGIINSADFYESIPLDKFPKELVNKSYNDARASQVALVSKEIETLMGLKASEFSEDETKDAAKLLKAAVTRYNAATGDESKKAYNDILKKASDLESELNKERENGNTKLTESLEASKVELRKQIRAEIDQENFAKKSQMDLIRELDTEIKYVPKLDREIITETTFNAMQAKYHLIYNEDGTIKLMQKNNPELDAIKKGTVATILTAKDFAIEFQKQKGYIQESTNDSNEHKPTIVTRNHEPNNDNAGLINEEFIKKQTESDARLRR